MFASCSLTLRSVSIGLLWLWPAFVSPPLAAHVMLLLCAGCTLFSGLVIDSRYIVSLWVQQLYILAVYCGYSDYVFYLCTVHTVIMYSSCVIWAHLLYILRVYCG